MANRRNRTEDAGERLTEMLDEQQQGQGMEVVKDNTPPPSQDVRQLDDRLIRQYQQVQRQEQSGNPPSPEVVRELADQFRAVALNQKLRNRVSFDAARAADVLYDLASGQQRDTVEEFWHVRRVKYR